MIHYLHSYLLSRPLRYIHIYFSYILPYDNVNSIFITLYIHFLIYILVVWCGSDFLEIISLIFVPKHLQYKIHSYDFILFLKIHLIFNIWCSSGIVDVFIFCAFSSSMYSVSLVTVLFRPLSSFLCGLFRASWEFLVSSYELSNII